jgi:hypothetical protein
MPVLGRSRETWHEVTGAARTIYLLQRAQETSPAVNRRRHTIVAADHQLEQFRQVFGLDPSLSRLAIGRGEAKAGIFAPALIEEVDVLVWAGSPYQSGRVSTTRLISILVLS